MLVLTGVICGWDTLCLRMVSPEEGDWSEVHTFTTRNVSTCFFGGAVRP